VRHDGLVTNSARLDYLHRSDADLLAQCRVETFRASGPGGQKRNKTDSAVRITHLPTTLTAQAFEDRSQHRNRAHALARLREAIALNVRRPVDLDAYTPPPELAAILPLAKRQRIGPQHRDYPLGLQVLLDLFVASGCSVADTAERLGLSTGALSRFLLADPHLRRVVNDLRTAANLRSLR
jgi:hypothetical protein